MTRADDTPRRLALCWLLVPLALGFLAHEPQLANGFVNWDDPNFVLTNPLVADPFGDGAYELLTTPKLSYPIPVTVLTYAAQTAATDGSASPALYHTVSLLLHLLCTLMAALLALRLGSTIFHAALAATVFAVHPVLVEPVAWATGQKDLLLTLFALAACWVRAGPRGDRWPATLTVLLLSALALGAKPTGMVMAPLLVVLDLALGRRPTAATGWTLYAAMAVLGALSALSGMSGHGMIGGQAPRPFGLDTLLEFAWGGGLALHRMIWPHPLLARYFPPEGATLVLAACAGLVVLGGAFFGAVFAYRRGHRSVFLGVLGALLLYAPVSGFIPLTRGPADSYLYAPMAFLTITLAWTCDRTLGHRSHRAIMVATLVFVPVLIWQSRAESRDWRSSLALWTDLAKHESDHPVALMRVGDAHLYEGRAKEALSVYDRLASTEPDFLPPIPAHAAILESLGQLDRAERRLEHGARLGERDVYRDEYAIFLLRNHVPPSNAKTAGAALRVRRTWLQTRVKKRRTLTRALELFRLAGDEASAQAVEARLRAVP